MGWDGTGKFPVWVGKKMGCARTENRWTRRKRTSNCANAEGDTTACKDKTGGREHSSTDGRCDRDGCFGTRFMMVEKIVG